ncbi:MAG: hypothetical protein COA57_14265 [Flavobacteriales bacterium]|nr:MAG: hypothetical protein COA57_14265 [Flavobacteriales bacterium]
MALLFNEIKFLRKRNDLLKYLVSTEIKITYKNKTLGVLWSILDPFFMMLIYILLVAVIFQKGGPQFPILLFSVLLPWRWFVQSISAAARAMVGNAKLIQTVNIPKSALPISRVLISLVNYLMGCVVLIPMLFLFEANFSWHLLWFPVLILSQFIFTIGAVLIVSVVGVYFRDLQNIIQFVVRLWFYLSPALYSINDIPQKYYHAYMVLNPFASLFASYKNVLVRGTAPNEYILWFTALGVILCIAGLAFFDKYSANITKNL